MSLGGYSEIPVEAAHQAYVDGHLAALNAKIGGNEAHWKVDKAWRQTVAGVNYFVHLTSDTGKHAHARFYVALGGDAAELSDAGEGLEEPHTH